LYAGVLLQIIHESIHDEVVDGLVKAYAQVKIGDPLDGQYYSMFDICTLWHHIAVVDKSEC